MYFKILQRRQLNKHYVYHSDEKIILVFNGGVVSVCRHNRIYIYIYIYLI